jgi:hypothetical protein
MSGCARQNPSHEARKVDCRYAQSEGSEITAAKLQMSKSLHETREVDCRKSQSEGSKITAAKLHMSTIHSDRGSLFRFPSGRNRASLDPIWIFEKGRMNEESIEPNRTDEPNITITDQL